MSGFADRVIDSFISNGIIEKENREIYAFGIRQGLSLILNIFSTIAVGLVLGMVWESLLFLVFYMPLRCYAGGFHAKTPLRCYLYSLLLVAVSLIVIRQAGAWVFYRPLTFAALLGIWFMVPVENATKPLNRTERVVYRKRARLIAVGEYGISILLGAMGTQQVSLCMLTAIMALCLMLVAEKIRKTVMG